MHAMKLVHEQMPLAVFEVIASVPFYFFAHAGIGLLQVNLLLRFVWFGESSLKAFGLEWPNDPPGLWFGRNQPVHQRRLLRGGQAEMPQRMARSLEAQPNAKLRIRRN